MTFKTYRIIGFLVLTMMVGGVFVWQRFQIDGLEKQVEQKDTEIVITQETGKVEGFEKRWEAIAQEHNDKDKNVTKEPKVNHDSNTTTLYFFGLFTED